MPRGDGTGPFGTFRNCMPVSGQGIPAQGFCGRRFFGRGRGFRNRYFATGTPGWATFGQPTQETEQSVEQAKNAEIGMLEQQLETIKKRLDELKKKQ